MLSIYTGKQLSGLSHPLSAHAADLGDAYSAVISADSGAVTSDFFYLKNNSEKILRIYKIKGSTPTLSTQVSIVAGVTAAFQFSHAFTGGLKGWQDADFQIITNKATTVGVLLGYVHINSAQTKSYSVWDGDR